MNKPIPYEAYDNSKADGFKSITHYSPNQFYVDRQKPRHPNLILNLSIINSKTLDRKEFIKELNDKWLSKTKRKKMPFLKRR